VSKGKQTKYLFRAAILLSIVLFAIATSGACTIEIRGDGGPGYMKRHAKVVLVGEVLDITDTPKTDLEMGANRYSVRLRVDRFWKGVKTREVTVHTDMVGCGPRFEVGRKYLVYAFGKELETANTRSRELQYATEDLRVIGPGKEFTEK
jgi:hypothetical protein